MLAEKGCPDGASSIGGFFQPLGSRWPARAPSAVAEKPPSVGANAPQPVSGRGAAAWAVLATVPASSTVMSVRTLRIGRTVSLRAESASGARAGADEQPTVVDMTVRG